MMRKPDFIDECYNDKDLSLLKKLTLIIPTYNRNYYLSRCLWYHAHFSFGQIIVADSSPEEKKVVNRETVAKIRERFGANILYLEYLPETEKYGGDIYRKWADASYHVTTEYSEFVTDKEFAIPLGLVRCISYLEKHPDYAAAEGKHLFLNGSKVKNGYKYSYSPRRAKKHSETNENPLERFRDTFEKTIPAINNCMIPSVMRSNCRKEVSSYITPGCVNEIRFGELVLAFFGHLQGKYHCEMTSISLIRDVSNLTAQKRKYQWNSPESSTTRYPTMQDYADNKLDDFAIAFRTALAEDIAKHTTITYSEALKFTNTTYPDYNYFLRYYLEKASVLGKIYQLFPGIEKIWINLPLYFQKLLNRISEIVFRKQLPIGHNHDTLKLVDYECALVQKLVISTAINHRLDKPIPLEFNL